MEKIFENETIYSPEEYIKFKNFHIKKYSSSYLTNTLVISLCLIVFSVAQFYSHHLGMGFVFIAILVGYLAWRFFYPDIFNKKQANRKSIKQRTKYTFTFYPYYFRVKSKEENFRFYYWKLYRIFETEDTFYLYINANYAFLISKNGFTLGTPSDFLNFIKKKTLFKYRK